MAAFLDIGAIFPGFTCRKRKNRLVMWTIASLFAGRPACRGGKNPVQRAIKTSPLLLVAATLIAGEPAFAELEEIVVTARKREERLQDLPMSVTALDAATMERLGVNDLADVTKYTPGVNLDSAFGLNDQRLVIRGLSPSRGRPNSAILVDGIDLTTESVSTAGGSMLFNSRMLDVERVEIVKGPQSALYGRAAFTGAIQYVTRNPSEEVESDIGVDIGDYGRRYLTAGVSGPVTDDFGLRFNALSWNEDGYYDEGFTGSSLGGGDGYGLGLTGKWDVTETFSARARVAYSNDDFDQQATFFDPVNTLIDPPESATTLAAGQTKTVINPGTRVGLFAGRSRDASGRTPYLTADPVTGAAYPGGEQHVLNNSLTLSWDISNGTITSYTGYADADSRQVLDADFDVRPNDAGTMDIARGGTVVDFSTDTRMLSQELRYASNFDGPVQLTVGALYWDENVDQTEQGLSALAFPFGSSDPGYFNLLAAEAARQPNNITRDTNSRSVYGLIEWNTTDQLKLSFEGRYAREAMDVTGTGCDPDQTFAAFRCLFSTPDLAAEFPPGSGLYEQLDRVYTSDSNNDYFFAPKALAEYRFTDEVMTYLSVSKGVKPGGISTVASGTWMDTGPEGKPDGNLDELKFGPEKLTAYEVGAKTTLFDRTLILNAALFYQQYTGKQIPVQNVTESDIAYTLIENAGEADVSGLELEVVWQASDNVRLQAGYSYLNGEYTNLTYQTNSSNSIARAGNCIPDASGNVCTISLDGNSLEDIPEHSVVALAGYYPPLGFIDAPGLNGLLEADVEYQSSRYTEEFNDREVASFTLVNARIGLQSERWDALIYVNNVFDDDTIKSWSSSTGLVATSERTDPSIAAFPAEGFAIAPPPRTWGVRANLRF